MIFNDMLHEYALNTGYNYVDYELLLESINDDNNSEIQKLKEEYSEDIAKRCEKDKQLKKEVSTMKLYAGLFLFCGLGITYTLNVKVALKALARSLNLTDDEVMQIIAMLFILIGTTLAAINDGTINKKMHMIASKLNSIFNRIK